MKLLSLHTQCGWDGLGITAQGQVVQSILSLMSSLRGQLIKCFTTL